MPRTCGYWRIRRTCTVKSLLGWYECWWWSVRLLFSSGLTRWSDTRHRFQSCLPWEQGASVGKSGKGVSSFLVLRNLLFQRSVMHPRSIQPCYVFVVCHIWLTHLLECVFHCMIIECIGGLSIRICVSLHLTRVHLVALGISKFLFLISANWDFSSNKGFIRIVVHESIYVPCIPTYPIAGHFFPILDPEWTVLKGSSSAPVS